MTRNHDSPVEQSREAHLVVTSCRDCGDPLEVPETAAEAGITCQACRDASHELAAIERSLRATDAMRVTVRHDGTSARLAFNTWAFDEQYRGRLTLAIIKAVHDTEHWELRMLYDPLGEDALVQSLVTLRRVDP